MDKDIWVYLIYFLRFVNKLALIDTRNLYKRFQYIYEEVYHVSGFGLSQNKGVHMLGIIITGDIKKLSKLLFRLTFNGYI